MNTKCSVMEFKIEIKTMLFVMALLTCFSCNSTKNEQQEAYKVYENHIALSGEENLRDLGGFIGYEGKRVLYRKLFRSGNLAHLTDADRDTLAFLGIEQLIDLRTTGEREEEPDRVAPEIIQHHLPLIADVGRDSDDRGDIMARVLSKQLQAQDYMLSSYRNIDSLKLTSWEKIFNLLEDNKTTLWHCTAGKDRAGMTTALVLSSLGVDRSEIIADFMASNTYLAEYIEQRVDQIEANYGEGTGELLRPMLSVQEAYLEAFFASIDEEYGNMEAFLTAIGVDTAKMKANYLE